MDGSGSFIARDDRGISSAPTSALHLTASIHLRMLSLLFFVCASLVWTAAISSGYSIAGKAYFVEAVRSQPLPNCPYRYLSYPNTCEMVDLWNTMGPYQQWVLELSADADGSYYLRAALCGNYLSYALDCSTHKAVFLMGGLTFAQKFLLIPAGSGAYYLEALGRAGCEYRYLSYNGPCTTDSADYVDLWNVMGRNERFIFHEVSVDALKSSL